MKTMNVLSFGAGTQSTAMVLLAIEKRILIDLIVFADTGAETPAVIEHAVKMQELVKNETNIPFIIAYPKQGAIENIENYLYGSGTRNVFPFWVKSGLLKRQCTGDFKIIPIQKAIREYLGIKPGKHFPKKELHVNMSLGITTDEIMRAKDNITKWITNKYPLLELGWDRQDAIKYCSQHGIKPPRSACFFCPYKNKNEWNELSEQEPNLYKKAVEYDNRLREVGTNFKGIREEMYLHKSKCALKEAVDAYKLQGSLFVDEDFSDLECEGHCFL